MMPREQRKWGSEMGGRLTHQDFAAMPIKELENRMREIDISRRVERSPADAKFPKYRGLTEGRCGFTAIRAGDRRVFEQFCRESYPHLAHFLSLVIPDEPIEEVCIDVYTKAWRSVAQSPRNYATLTLIISIGYREASSRILARQAGWPVMARSHRNRTGKSESTCQYDRSGLAELGWKARVVAALVYGMRFSMETVCQITAMTDQEIDGHLSAALRRFRGHNH